MADDQTKARVGRPPNTPGEAATATIVLRVTPSRKGAYVRGARRKNSTLAAWIFEACDRESDYKED